MDRLRSRLVRDQRGTTIVEVVVAAAILLIASAAIVQLVTGAQTESGQQRISAIATDLAQSQLEELRSQKFESLLSLPTGAVETTAGGHVFSVQKSATWAMESPPGASGCTSSGRNPEALKVSVSVTWANTNRRPIVLDSLIAAPPGARGNRGNYIVQLTDRDNVGVPGVPVVLNGSGMSFATDANGCVRFTNVPAGDYTVSFQKPGYVDRDNVNAVTKDITVVDGETGSSSFDYDLAGSALVSFIAKNPSNSGTSPTVVPGARFVNSSTTVTGILQNGGTQAATPSMWPAADAYSIFADTCTAGQPVGQVTIPQGTQGTATARLPLLRLEVNNVDRNANYTLNGSVVTTCGSQLADVTGTTSGGRWQSFTSEQLAVPPGTLARVCVWAQINATTYEWRESTTATLEPGYTTTPKDIDLGNFRQAQSGPLGSRCT